MEEKEPFDFVAAASLLEREVGAFVSGEAYAHPGCWVRFEEAAAVARRVPPLPPPGAGDPPLPAALSAHFASRALLDVSHGRLFAVFTQRALALLTDEEVRAACEGLACACAAPGARSALPSFAAAAMLEAVEAVSATATRRALCGSPPPEWCAPAIASAAAAAAAAAPAAVPAALAALAAALAALGAVLESGVGQTLLGPAARRRAKEGVAAAVALLARGPRGGLWEPEPVPAALRLSLLAPAPALAMEWLTHDAVAYFEESRLPPALQEDKRRILDELGRQVAAVLAGRLHLVVFGSTLNGLGQKGSDMDVTLLIEGPSSGAGPASAAGRAAFKLLEKSLVFRRKGEGWAKRTSVARAAVPVITLVHTLGLSVDLVVNHRLPMHNTALLASYCAVDARVQPLAFAVKRWAKVKALNKAYEGFISSYAWATLCVFFLQRVGVLCSLQSEDAVAAGGDAGARVVREATCEGRHAVRFLDVSELSQGGAAAAAGRAAVATLINERRLRRLESLGSGGATAAGGGGAGAFPGSGLSKAPHADLGDALCAPEVELFDSLWGREAWAANDSLTVGQLVAGFFAYFSVVVPPHGPTVSIRVGSFLRRSTFEHQAAPAVSVGGGGGGGGGGAGAPSDGERDGEAREGGDNEDEDDAEGGTGSSAPYRLSIEDAFEVDHDLGRPVKPRGGAVLRAELLSAAAACRRPPPAALAALFSPSPAPSSNAAKALRQEEQKNAASEPPRVTQRQKERFLDEVAARAAFQGKKMVPPPPLAPTNLWVTAHFLRALGGLPTPPRAHAGPPVVPFAGASNAASTNKVVRSGGGGGGGRGGGGGHGRR